MTFRPMPFLTVLTVISLGILIVLGNWQYGRYAAKMASPTLTEQTEESALIRVALDRTSNANAQQVYGFADSEPIWRRYVPGTLEDTSEPVLVMVEATGGPTPIPVAVRELPETVTFDGLVTERGSSGSAFSGRDDAENDVWYSLNPEAMARRFGLSGTPRVVEPVIMSVRNADQMTQVRQTLNPYAFANPVDPLPPERHFGYALTWWGMALGLIGVYVALHHSRGRLRFKKA
ncbi:MAG: SURF1 family cytochrome oxidase biogenesis protein [Pseudomonadota bacterium]